LVLLVHAALASYAEGNLALDLCRVLLCSQALVALVVVAADLIWVASCQVSVLDLAACQVVEAEVLALVHEADKAALPEKVASASSDVPDVANH
jgi:hypothetical protein